MVNLNLLISVNDFRQIWENQPVYLLTQCLFLLGGLCTLKHAISNGGRWPLLWLTITLNGIMLELISLSIPNVNFYWHSQGPIMLFGKSLPLGIVFFYPYVYYTSILCASLLRLPRFYESLAAGIVALVINLPIDYVILKYIQTTWHDSDPIMLERNYSVPWNSYNFHFIYTIIQCILFNVNENIRKRGDETFKKKPSQESKWKLFSLNIVLTIPALFITFAVLYHAPHDFLAVHTQIIFLLMFSSAVGIVWRVCCTHDDTIFKRGMTTGRLSQKYIVLYLFLHNAFYLLTPLLFDPEKHMSTGPYQPIGPCNVTEPVHTILGKVLQRKKYLCWKNHRQDYFDFHCVPEFAPLDNEIISHYTICGTAFQNKTEFIGIMIGTTVVAFCVFKTIFYSTRSHSSDKERKKV